MYQWRKNGTAIPNGTSATLTVANAQHEHSGSYDVVISNVAASVSDKANAMTRNENHVFIMPAAELKSWQATQGVRKIATPANGWRQENPLINTHTRYGAFQFLTSFVGDLSPAKV